MRRLILCSLLCLVLDGVHCNANQEVEVSAFGSVSTKERRKADAMTGIGSYIDQAEVKLGGMMPNINWSIIIIGSTTQDA